MTATVTAVYQDGVLRPAAPLPLADGTPVRLIVSTDPDPTPGPTAEEVLARVRAVAALPEELGGDPTVTGRDHDRILYGGPSGAR